MFLSSKPCRIIKRAHPEPMEVLMSWTDEAIITGQKLVKRPFWYEDLETNRLYYDLYGCIGWPSEVNDRDEGLAGYVAIVGVRRPRVENKPVEEAVFQLVTEYESKDVPILLDQAQKMRREYGFGIYPGLLESFFGDPDRFITTLAMFNEHQQMRASRPQHILISPPHDYYELKSFDHFVRSFRSTLMPDHVRFYFGNNDLLRSRLREFRQSDPAVYAMGGLVHTLLSDCVWMNQVRSNVFTVGGLDDDS